MELATKIADKSARVAVTGLGYVGLPLAVGFARAGYPVLGLDVDERKITGDLGAHIMRVGAPQLPG